MQVPLKQSNTQASISVEILKRWPSNLAPEMYIVKETKRDPLCRCHDNGYAAGRVLIKTKILRFYLKQRSSTLNNLMGRVKTISGLEIATHWSPMRLKIRCWRPDIENWSPAGDPFFSRGPFNLKGKQHLLEDETHFIRIDIINQTHDSSITNWIHHVFDSAASLF